jgi:HCOMODA/2-hydroxy-3-carboxy-muconic semialdehyde decarboxylase
MTDTQAPPASAGPVDPALIGDLVAAGRILAAEGVLDAFGHVSVRHPAHPDRFLMSRSLAPALVTADDIVEHDLDGAGIDANGRGLFLERFIHGEIYRVRPDVMAVVHSHSQSVIPFGGVGTPMQAMYHNAAFLARGVPVFDIRRQFGMTSMLVSNGAIGRALAAELGDKPVVLMRGHGSVAVGPSLPVAVFRAVYTEVNAKLQTQAAILGGPITFLAPEEGALADKTNIDVVGRPWELWKRKVLGG